MGPSLQWPVGVPVADMERLAAPGLREQATARGFLRKPMARPAVLSCGRCLDMTTMTRIVLDCLGYRTAHRLKAAGPEAKEDNAANGRRFNAAPSIFLCPRTFSVLIPR